MQVDDGFANGVSLHFIPFLFDHLIDIGSSPLLDLLLLLGTDDRVHLLLLADHIVNLVLIAEKRFLPFKLLAGALVATLFVFREFENFRAFATFLRFFTVLILIKFFLIYVLFDFLDLRVRLTLLLGLTEESGCKLSTPLVFDCVDHEEVTLGASEQSDTGVSSCLV